MSSGNQPSPMQALPGAAQRVAWAALGTGIVLTLLKFLIFILTNSAAVLSDALESIINLAAAAMAILSTWYASRPPDREHPYGHGRVEFIAAGVEGAMVFFAGATIGFESIRRLVVGTELHSLNTGTWMLAGVGILAAALAAYVWRSGIRIDSPTLIADGKHLATDAATTAGVIVGLILVRATGLPWVDPVFALLMGGVVVLTGVRLIRASWGGLIDRVDVADHAAILEILDGAVAAGRIKSYHKVRHRHDGSFHWVDLHVQVPGDMTVRDAHAEVGRIQHEIEQRLSRATARAHIEPADDAVD